MLMHCCIQSYAVSILIAKLVLSDHVSIAMKIIACTIAGLCSTMTLPSNSMLVLTLSSIIQTAPLACCTPRYCPSRHGMHVNRHHGSVCMYR